jgi:hypothetical protein
MPRKAERRPFSEEEFRAWLPSSGHTNVVIMHGDDNCWSALFVEFNIAGLGRSEEEALHDARKLFWGYLQYCFMDGRSFEESRKPIPRRSRARYRVEGQISRLKRGVASLVEVDEATTFDPGRFDHLPRVAP